MGKIQYGWKWDFAASRRIIKEAGGRVRHRKKESGDLDETVASNGELQRDLESVLDDAKYV